MTRTGPQTYVRWMIDGHDYFLACLKQVDDARLGGSSHLEGWTGKHLLSHVGHNARALARLAHWAATGEPTPMYPSPSARAQEIEAGARWETARLRDFVAEEQERLTTALGGLTAEHWQAPVVTAQGRTVPARTIPWLRSREVWVHAVDLPAGGDFADFPGDFLDALIEDALIRRRTAQSVAVAARATDRATEPGVGEGMCVEGPAVDLARWLTRRVESPALRTASGGPLPELPPWL
ncbi:maleylpyruvate isomerase family mycothiol-dependent enzyme [Streptomyces sp. NPDC005953]|uniref:maleylpyruvate isomerase family mycothiol-dependent enzyme n=1 Tax=Streptomyces sp. NPDC005953 TaxID=3156719 RepID=UPI0033CFAEEC